MYMTSSPVSIALQICGSRLKSSSPTGTSAARAAIPSERMNSAFASPRHHASTFKPRCSSTLHKAT